MTSMYRPRAEAWLYALLSTDTSEADITETTIPLATQGIGADDVHEWLAPPGTSGIYLVYQYQGGFDINASGKIRVMGSLLFVVKVSGEDVSTNTLLPFADRLDTLIQRGASTLDGYRFESRRESEIVLPPVANGDVISREIGGLYRVFVHKV